MQMLFYYLMDGVTVVTMTRFEPHVFMKVCPKVSMKIWKKNQAVQTYHVRFAVLVPPICVLLAKHPMVDEYDLSSIKVRL